MPQASMVQTGISTEQLWTAYCTELLHAAQPQFDPTVQVCCFNGTLSNTNLQSEDPTVQNLTVFQMGGMVPKWSAAYAPGADLAGAYAQFLDWIDQGGDSNPNLDSLLSRARTASDSARKVWKDALDAARADWIKGPDSGLSFPEYCRRYHPEVEDYEEAYVSAQDTVSKLLRQQSGPDYKLINDARTRVGNKTGALNSTEANSFNMPVGKGSYDPTITLGGDFAQTYREWQTNSVNNRISHQITITGDTFNRTLTQVGWPPTVTSGSSWFFGWREETQDTAFDLTTDRTSFSMTVSFTGLGLFPVAPGNWYLPSIVEGYRNKLSKGAPTFFGESGMMSLLPAQTIIGFEPKIELTLNRSDYEHFQRVVATTTTTSIRFGPFVIARHTERTGYTMDNLQWSDSECKVTIGPIKTSVPNFMGIICTKM